MKHFRHFYVWLLISVLLAIGISCGELYTIKATTLELSVGELVFDAGGGEQEVKISSNAKWAVSGTGEWCVTNVTSGEGDVTIIVKAIANDDVTNRTATLTVEAGDAKRTLGVTQRGKNAAIPDKVKFEVPQEGGTLAIKVRSSVAYKVTIPESCGSWIRLAPESRAVSDTTYRFIIDGNKEGESRTGHIIFATESAQDTVKIFQAQQDRLILTERECSLPAKDTLLTVELRTNVEYEIVMPEADWMKRQETRAMRTDKLTFSIEANATAADREAMVVVKDQNSDLADTLRVRQSQKDFLRFVEKEVKVKTAGDTVSVEVKSSVAYDVVIPEEVKEWVKQLPKTRATNPDTLSFSVSANAGVDDREAVVVVKAKSGALADTLHIRQTQKDSLSFGKKEYGVAAAGGTIQVEVTGNIEYKVTVPAAFREWITETPATRAMTAKTYTFTVSENRNTTRREGYILFAGNAVTDTVYVIQERGEAFLRVVGEESYEVEAAGGTLTVNVETNAEYKVEPDVAWVRKESSSFTQVSLTVDENTTAFVRKAIVVLRYGNKVSDTLRIKQEGKPVSGNVYTETVNGVSFDMVRVQAGTFMMGATPEQGNDGYDWEKPVHKVTLTQDYYIGQFEVTQGLWKAVMGNNPSFFKKGDNYPVETVNWKEAQEFCTKLSRLTGRVYALPTEAQWEFAARGGVMSKGYKYSGSDDVKDVACYGEDSRTGSTHPVGEETPNELGIYDMSGNVEEWCQDGYNSGVTYGADAQTDPTGPATAWGYVYRGGGWSSKARDTRVSSRIGAREDYRHKSIGFRIVLLPNQLLGEYLELPEDIYNVASVGGTMTVDVVANVEYEVEIPSGVDWLSKFNSSARQLSLSVAENTGNSFRETTVTLRYGNNLSATLKVKQAGKWSDRTISVNGIDFKMVYVQGGTFGMGEAGGRSNPLHDVTLSDYYIGQFEVTQGLWKAVGTDNNPSAKKGDNNPVEFVNWDDAQRFCTTLNQMTEGQRTVSGEQWEFCLPTEAQWEFAARGGVMSKGYKYSGSDDENDVCRRGDYSDGPFPVGEKTPNELGIHDMSGNVWEWCYDYYGDYPSTPETDPMGPKRSSMYPDSRVYRGGSYNDGAKEVAGRAFTSQGSGANRYVGFRIVLCKKRPVK